jgi:SAM-dependent methyltransferase
MLITRQSYQEKRLALLRTLLNVWGSEGLEIGAYDLPTVSRSQGYCRYADYRSTDQLAELGSLPRDQVCDVDFLVARGATLPEQISARFDYVIACHVIEHVADPIGYVMELRGLLKDGGIVFLTVPDKRSTPDRNRPSTSIEHLLMDHHDGCRYPTIEHIVEFHRHWMRESHGTEVPLHEAYALARDQFASGQADVHCHVWTDAEFREQFEGLLNAGMLPGLSLAAFEETPDGFNEFSIVFRRHG